MKNNLTSYLAGILGVTTLLVSCHEHRITGPADLADFVLEDHLEMYIVALEPLILDPVAFAVDEYGGMYVVENCGYPDPVDGGQPVTREGRIARLTDQDGDGTYDQRTDFAEGFTYPNGVMVWDGGVFVTCAPDIFYLRDTDGDGIADEQKTVLTGFSDTKTAQIRMSHPTLGLDGWVYVTGGLNGGKIISPLYPDRDTVTYASGDGRFNPSTFEFEVTGGKSQFGLTIDAFGRRFGCSNRHPVMHIVMEPSQLNRNDLLLFNETVQNVSPVQADAILYAISGAALTADYIPRLIGRSHQGTFTAASGVFVFDDMGLTDEHLGNVFICESAQNLVQRQVMQASGATFRSQIAQDGSEFLASTDEWFRPVFLGHGPQGGLYVVDMHRKVIDHPAYIPEEVRGDLDYDSGKDKGRIYRVANKGHRRVDGEWLTQNAAIEEICDWLESPSAWRRSTAFRLLLERRDKASFPLLRSVAASSTHLDSRSKALWSLFLLGGAEAALVEKMSTDEHAGIREHTIQLAANMQQREGMLEVLLSGASDENMRVRFLSSLALGDLQGEEVIGALANVAHSDGEDKWSRAAVLSGIGGRIDSFLYHLQLGEQGTAAFAAVMQDLAGMLGRSASWGECRNLLDDILNAHQDGSWRYTTALGLLDGMMSRPSDDLSTIDLWGKLSRTYRSAGSSNSENFINEVIATARDVTEDSARRKVAIELLGFVEEAESLPVLSTCLATGEHPDIQLAAVKALARMETPEAAMLLTSEQLWSGYAPRLRSAVISVLVSRSSYIKILFDAVEVGIVQAAQIPSSDRQRMMKSKQEDIQIRAQSIFKELEAGDRMQVYEDFRSTVDENGNPGHGKAVFTKICAACHAYAGEGGQVGPDLTGIKNQPVDALLLHTIVPNYEVYPSYQATMVETKDDQNLSGWIKAESDHSITLRTAYGTDEQILRSNIRSIYNTGRSLMPDGLEQTVSREEVNDLMAFLRSGG